MLIIVTGATSFIGIATIRQLLTAGHQVTALIRPSSKNPMRPAAHPQLEIVSLDLSELERLPDYVKQADAWLHLAWDGVGSAGRQDPAIQELNITMSLAAVRMAARLGCDRFIFSGSQAEYGISEDLLDEEHPCHPVSAYGKAKLSFGSQAMALCQELQMCYIHLRIFSVYGPGDHPWSLVNSCLSAWQRGGAIRLGECTQQWNYLYIDDAARAIALIVQSGQSGVYNVAGTDTRPLRSFVEEMYRLCGSRGSFDYGMREPGAEGPASLRPSTAKLQAATGWKPQTSYAEGIYETMHRM